MTTELNKGKSLDLVIERLQLEKDTLTTFSFQQKFNTLSLYVESLIDSDFNKLVSILYRIDVSEQKIKKALTENSTGQSAGNIIAQLLIEREIEKLKFRTKYSNK